MTSYNGYVHYNDDFVTSKEGIDIVIVLNNHFWQYILAEKPQFQEDRTILVAGRRDTSET